jgi:hypothetical protein
MAWIAWVSYNLVVYAVVPLTYFRSKYSARQLNLVSSDRRGDARLIIAVLLLESARSSGSGELTRCSS